MSKRCIGFVLLAAVLVLAAGAVVASSLSGSSPDKGRAPQVRRAVPPAKQKLVAVKAQLNNLGIAKPLGAAIAYGFVQYDGSLRATSGNVTSEWRSDIGRYYIRINNVTYTSGPYIVLVTPEGNGGIYFPATWEDNGALVVCMGASDNESAAQAGFQFVVYKVS